MQIKLIFKRKLSHLASFWKCEFLEHGNGLLKLADSSYKAWRMTRVTYLQMIERDPSAQYVIIDADQMRKLRLHFDASTFVSEAESSLLQEKKRREKKK